LLAAVLLPPALATLFFYPVIFQGKTFYAFDILQSFAPWGSPESPRPLNTLISDPVNIFYSFSYHLKKGLENGVLPFWNSALLGGLPYAPPSYPLFYLAHLLLPITAAHDLLLWLHLAASGVFMAFYLREIGLESGSALLGAAAWMFNGYLMVWFEFENVYLMAFTFPLTLYLIERWLKGRSRVIYLFLIATLALSFSAHHAQLLIYQFLCIGAYCVFRCLRISRGASRIDWKGMALLFCSFWAALVISANFVSVHLSGYEGSQRVPFSCEALFNEIGIVPVKYLATLIFPDFFGSPALPLCFTPGARSYANYNELCIYGGVTVFLLALACVPYLRERFVAFYLITAVTAISMAMGSLLYCPLASYIPSLNLSTPTRILYVFGFSLCVLAALGSQMVLSKTDSRRRWAVALWLAVLLFAISIVLYVQTEQGLQWAAGSIKGLDPETVVLSMREFFHPLSPILLKPLLLLALSIYLLAALALSGKRVFQYFLLFIILYDLMSFGWAYNTASPRQLEYPVTGGIRFLSEDRDIFRVATYGNFLHNSLVPFGIQDGGGYSSFYPKRYGDYLHLSQHGSDAPLPEQHSRWVFWRSFGSPLMDLLNIKYLVTSPNISIRSEQVELVYGQEVNIYRNKGAFPRAFFVPGFVVLKDKEGIYGAMAGFSRKDFRERVILETPPPSGFGEDDASARIRGPWSVNIVNYQANRIDLQVSSSQKGFVIVGENYHPSWKAYVNDRETPVIRANYIMRAIPVEEGTHEIRLVFRPVLLIAGISVSALGWMAFGVILLAIKLAGRRSPAPGKGVIRV
jgi:hypothetical protein